MTSQSRRPRVLLLAEECNPEWPSLPIVAYKYALELAKLCDVTVATHIRNRDNIEKRAADGLDVRFVDNEWVAGPMFRFARFLRGGEEVGFSTAMIFNYLPYLAFEHAAWRMFRDDLRAGNFDIVHRTTPMSPTLPSWIAHKLKSIPFVIGPLNGNLDWPKEFLAEQAREKEKLRGLRNLYKLLPYTRSTYDYADAVLSAFAHTRADLPRVEDARIVSFPEIGFDPQIFHAEGAQPAGSRGADGKRHFMYAGRLVPYKLPELPVQAFAQSEALRQHHLHIVGDGPERARIEAVIAEHGLQACVTLHGRQSQGDVADMMRSCDAFVFPSIRELGAGVVVEAMACGMHLMVANYGAPGDLVGEDRGDRVGVAPFDQMVRDFRVAMEHCVAQPDHMAGCGARAKSFADGGFPWSRKGEKTLEVYQALLDKRAFAGLGY